MKPYWAGHDSIVLEMEHIGITNVNTYQKVAQMFILDFSTVAILL